MAKRNVTLVTRRKVTRYVKRSGRGTKKQASMDKEPERIVFETRMSHRNPTMVGYQPIRVWGKTLVSRSLFASVNLLG